MTIIDTQIPYDAQCPHGNYYDACQICSGAKADFERQMYNTPVPQRIIYHLEIKYHNGQFGYVQIVSLNTLVNRLPIWLSNKDVAEVNIATEAKEIT